MHEAPLLQHFLFRGDPTASLELLLA